MKDNHWVTRLVRSWNCHDFTITPTLASGSDVGLPCGGGIPVAVNQESSTPPPDCNDLSTRVRKFGPFLL